VSSRRANLWVHNSKRRDLQKVKSGFVRCSVCYRSTFAWSASLYDLLNPHVDTLVVCNPGKNALLKDGNKSDRIDARNLAELLRGNELKPVYQAKVSFPADLPRPCCSPSPHKQLP